MENVDLTCVQQSRCLVQIKSKAGVSALGWLAGELIVVFAGVSAAFVVENYRDNKNQVNEMHQSRCRNHRRIDRD